MSFPTLPALGEQLTAADLGDFTLNPAYTYGETIAALKAVYSKASDSKVYKASAATQAHIDAFLGLTYVSGVLNDTNRIIGPGKVITGLSSLTVGSPYYLSDTAGEIQLNPGTIPILVGVAINSTALLVLGQRDLIPADLGDGSDGALAFDGSTDVASVSSRSGATYTLTKDVFATVITITGASTVINCAGYKVRAKYGINRASGSGLFHNDGGAGGAGADGSGSGGGITAGTGGTAGAAAPGVTVPPGVAGVAGANGVATNSGGAAGLNGTNGTNGTAATRAASNTAGASSGAAGDASATGDSARTGGSGGTGGASGATAVKSPRTTVDPYTTFSSSALLPVQVSASPASGASGAISFGASGGSIASGGGGGSGAPGGYVDVGAWWIWDQGSGTMFRSKGGTGGAAGQAHIGSAAVAGRCGGSSGGSGGNGGIIRRMYRYLTGTAATDVTGGAGGAKSNAATPVGTGSSSNGSDGTAGSSGSVIDIRI